MLMKSYSAKEGDDLKYSCVSGGNSRSDRDRSVCVRSACIHQAEAWSAGSWLWFWLWCPQPTSDIRCTTRIPRTNHILPCTSHSPYSTSSQGCLHCSYNQICVHGANSKVGICSSDCLHQVCGSTALLVMTAKWNIMWKQEMNLNIYGRGSL